MNLKFSGFVSFLSLSALLFTSSVTHAAPLNMSETYALLKKGLEGSYQNAFEGTYGSSIDKASGDKASGFCDHFSVTIGTPDSFKNEEIQRLNIVFRDETNGQLLTFGFGYNPQDSRSDLGNSNKLLVLSDESEWRSGVVGWGWSYSGKTIYSKSVEKAEITFGEDGRLESLELKTVRLKKGFPLSVFADTDYESTVRCSRVD